MCRSNGLSLSSSAKKSSVDLVVWDVVLALSSSLSFPPRLLLLRFSVCAIGSKIMHRWSEDGGDEAPYYRHRWLFFDTLFMCIATHALPHTFCHVGWMLQPPKQSVWAMAR